MDNSALNIVISLLASYLLGSIPFGLIAGFVFKRIDIRNYGSGNIGASNVLRLLGWPLGLLVLLLDTAKGFIPVWWMIGNEADPLLVVGAALMSLLGHNFSIFLGFKGGKGVATSLGVLIGLVPNIAVIAFFIWLGVVTVTRYISVASIVAGISVPLMMLLSSNVQNQFLGRKLPDEYIYLGVVAAGFIVLKHRSNIRRLLTGTENKFGERISVSDRESS